MIKLDNITKSYFLDGMEIPVLKGVSAEFNPGEITAIMGPSGVGKTTLLNIVGALDRASGGDIFFDGKSYSKMNEAEFASFRNKSIGFVFQFHHLLPEFTALENVMIPQLIGGISSTEARRNSAEILKELGLEERLQHKPSELSGGEQQRVAVARALVNRPKLVLGDEPSGNLDEVSGEKLTELMWKLCREKGYGFVIVTHNPQLAEKADRIIQMRDGKIV